MLSDFFPDFGIQYIFQWRSVWLALPKMLAGAVVTMEVAFLSIAFGLAISFFLAIARLQEKGFGYRLATIWVELARNTPALLQIYLSFFGLGAFGIQLSSFSAVLLAITFNNAGYLTEILRGGIQGIPLTQMRASRSLGMTQRQAYWYVICPQLFRRVFYPICNQVVWAILTTSLGMVVGLKELAGVTQVEQSRTFRTFEFFVVAAIIYYIIAKVFLLLAHLVGRRYLRLDS